jgi:hypothetical protein
VNPVSNAEMRTAQEIIRDVRVNQSPNGVCYATAGEITLPSNDIERMIQAIPHTIAAALTRKAFYFVPLTIGDGEKTLIAERFDQNLIDSAICHRNIDSGDSQCVFISTRLLDDRFSIAFELYINVGHAFVDKAGLSAEFGELVWGQAVSGVRGETSLDAHEFRKQALGDGTLRGGNEKAKSEYLAAAFSDSIAIYLLSLYLDVEYRDLREREYPLLAPAAMAERLKKIAALFPPNPEFQFNILYRRRT